METKNLYGTYKKSIIDSPEVSSPKRIEIVWYVSETQTSVWYEVTVWDEKSRPTTMKASSLERAVDMYESTNNGRSEV